MTIQINPVTPPTSRPTAKGERLELTATSGRDVLAVSIPAGAPPPAVGKLVLLDGFFMPARRAGDLPRLWVR